MGRPRRRYPAEDLHGEGRTNEARHSGLTIDGRTLRHAGSRASQRLRRRVDKMFGWGKVGRPAIAHNEGARLAQVSFIGILTVGCYALLLVARRITPSLRVSDVGPVRRQF